MAGEVFFESYYLNKFWKGYKRNVWFMNQKKTLNGPPMSEK
jgi:hypothetical protein